MNVTSPKYGYYAVITGYAGSPALVETSKDESGAYILKDEPLHSVVFTKKSSYDKSVLGGAGFRLYGTSNRGTYIDLSAASEADTGTVRFSGLESGTYTLEETSAPEGYTINTKKYPVIVSSDGTVTIHGLSATNGVYDFYDKKNQDKQIVVQKVWNDGLTAHIPSELAMTIQTSVPDASARTFSVIYDANGGSFGTGDDGNAITTNIVRYNAKNTIISGTYATPEANKTGYGFAGWTAKKAGTSADFDPEENANNASLNSVADGGGTYVYAVYKPVELTTGKDFNAIIKSLVAGSVKRYTATDAKIKAIQVTKTAPKDGATTANVAAEGSAPILAYFDNDTIYLYAGGADQIALGKNSSNMFYELTSLTSVDVSKFDTSSVVNMHQMFQGCTSLTSLDLSAWNTSSVKNIDFMFNGCKSLTSLDVSKWDTHSVVDMAQMFQGCTSLTNLDLSAWDTGSVKYMVFMFAGCSKLPRLDVSKWNTGSVTDMSDMFYKCSGLTSLDVSKWDTGNVTDMSDMFDGCSGLATIYVSNSWNTDKVTSSSGMFKDCTSLVGGAGTAYNASHTDTAYAHIDGGTSNPGYFTQSKS